MTLAQNRAPAPALAQAAAQIHADLDPAFTSGRALADTAAIADMMRLYGQTVRTNPTADITDAERILRARLVLEEALEFVAAMGCRAQIPADGDWETVRGDSVVIVSDGPGKVDLVEATDAISDLTVVTKGSAHTLGVPCDAATAIVHATNMAKAGPDGKIMKDAGGKTQKPEGWVSPTAALAALLGQA